jgi:hypothetical protein
VPRAQVPPKAPLVPCFPRAWQRRSDPKEFALLDGARPRMKPTTEPGFFISAEQGSNSDRFFIEYIAPGPILTWSRAVNGRTVRQPCPILQTPRETGRLTAGVPRVACHSRSSECGRRAGAKSAPNPISETCTSGSSHIPACT